MKLIIIIALALLVVTACDDPIRIDPPHAVAADYFDALYNQRDLEKAISLSSEANARMLNHYGTVTTVGHYMYNMRFEHVDIRAERPTGITYLNNADSVRIRVAFTGYTQGRRIDELREVILVSENGHWRVDRLLDAPYQ